MGKSIREVMSYAGYTVSIYFLCRYVNGNYELTYKLFAWMFLTCTVLFFENNAQEVAKEISKSAIILMCTYAIDAQYSENNGEIIRIFVGQVVWQLSSLIIVMPYKYSVKLHGRYARKLAMHMSFIGFCCIIVLNLNVVLSIILVNVYGLFKGFVYYLACETEKKKLVSEKNKEEQEHNKELIKMKTKLMKYKQKARRERECHKELIKAKTELIKYKQKEKIEKTRTKRECIKK